MKIDIVRTIEIDYSTFEGLITSALEGGSNYWYLMNEMKGVSEDRNEPLTCRIAKAVYEGVGTVDIYDVEDENTFLGQLNLHQCIRSFQLLADQYPYVLQNILDENNDAGDADIFFQLAVMGEVIYG